MRVFISSTYLDLVSHRAAVADAIERLGLEVNRMEAFGARPEEAVQACLSEVERSDLFVGIYAYRYGYIPVGSVISVTETEFRHALIRKKPIFCFFVDQNYPWPTEMIDGEPGRALLNAFAGDVARAVVRDTFTTPDVLASRVATSLGRFMIAHVNGKDDERTIDHFLQLTITDTAAMLCVDVMRLLCVAGSDLARTSNVDRYKEFVDIADLHLIELRTQITRIGVHPARDIAASCFEVENRLAWALTRLRGGPKLDRTWADYVALMRETTDKIHAVNTTLGGKYYLDRAQEAADITNLSMQSAFGGEALTVADTFARTRFALQSMVLKHIERTNAFPIATIRDDIDKRLAVPYFAIDRMLLGRSIAQLDGL